MLDWFYDTPIVQELKKIRDKPIQIKNIEVHQKKIALKRINARLKRKRKNKILKSK